MPNNPEDASLPSVVQAVNLPLRRARARLIQHIQSLWWQFVFCQVIFNLSLLFSAGGGRRAHHHPINSDLCATGTHAQNTGHQSPIRQSPFHLKDCYLRVANQTYLGMSGIKA